MQSIPAYTAKYLQFTLIKTFTSSLEVYKDAIYFENKLRSTEDNKPSKIENFRITLK